MTMMIMMMMMMMMLMTMTTIQGGFRLEVLEYDAGGNVNTTYNLTSPADGFIGASNVT